jgi:hypothetical protein
VNDLLIDPGVKRGLGEYSASPFHIRVAVVRKEIQIILKGP